MVCNIVLDTSMINRIFYVTSSSALKNMPSYDYMIVIIVKIDFNYLVVVSNVECKI